VVLKLIVVLLAIAAAPVAYSLIEELFLPQTVWVVKPMVDQVYAYFQPEVWNPALPAPSGGDWLALGIMLAVMAGAFVFLMTRHTNRSG
jgi:uncharacterized membrane protein